MYNKNYWKDAEYWIQRGVWVIPLNGLAKPKKGWVDYNSPNVAIGSLEALQERTTREDWDKGIAAILHLSDLVMLDIDVHRETANGFRSYDWLVTTYSDVDCETTPDEMTTWEMFTPGNGMHLLFQRPADFPKDFKKKALAPGVELIAYGQTPLPPTKRWKKNEKTNRYVEAGAYEWLQVYFPEIKPRDNWDERFTFTRESLAEEAERMPPDVPQWGIWCALERAMNPDNVKIAPLPWWLTEFAKNPKVPLMSMETYKAYTEGPRQKPKATLVSGFDDLPLD
jgi:hypothetical protein